MTIRVQQPVPDAVVWAALDSGNVSIEKVTSASLVVKTPWPWEEITGDPDFRKGEYCDNLKFTMGGNQQIMHQPGKRLRVQCDVETTTKNLNTVPGQQHVRTLPPLCSTSTALAHLKRMIESSILKTESDVSHTYSYSLVKASKYGYNSVC